MKNQAGEEIDGVCVAPSHPCLLTNKGMSAAAIGFPPLGSTELQTAHSNARINVCDYNLLHNYFLHMFEKSEETQPLKDKNKKCKKSRKSSKGREKRVEPFSSLYSAVPEIQISRNASWFAMFASVRRTCLEHQSKAATLLQAAASTAWQEATETDAENSDTDSNKPTLPKVVGIGLKTVFDIIRETEQSHPVVCQKALHSLLDVLQGLQPEDLRDEPAALLESLFTLLLELASRSGQPEAVNGNLELGTHIRALACSCLLALAVAGGSSPHLLRATAALLMSPRSHAGEMVLMPGILASLQRSVFSILIKRTDHPDFMSHGVPVSSLIDSFQLNIKQEAASRSHNLLYYSMASDGHHLFIHTNAGLFKVGSGFSGTIRGEVYKHRPDFYNNDRYGWLGCASNTLCFKPSCPPHRTTVELIIINKDTLEGYKVISAAERFYGPHLMLTDGENVGLVAAGRDDTLTVKFLSLATNPMAVVAELPIKLARKCVQAVGSSLIEEEAQERSQIDFGIDEEVAQVGVGRDFGLMLTTNGKLYYTGKSAAIGHKQPCLQGKWSEVVFYKSGSSTHISYFAVGHDGSHALLVDSEGAVYFTGTPKRGEDGDLYSKQRRPPKAKKPTKMARMEKQAVVCVACNAGTSCVVNKKGELFIYGKDSTYADFVTGKVNDLASQVITHVAVGKAHIVALSHSGDVFSFGVNNKGQCGREFPSGPIRPHDQHAAAVAVSVVGSAEGSGAGGVGDEASDHEGEIDVEALVAADFMCPPGKHMWRHEQCMVCSVCGECTGYGAGCVSANRPDRNPGMLCGCGSGDSGCAECGICRACVGEAAANDMEAGGGGVGVAAAGLDPAAGLPVRDLIRLNLLAGQQQQPQQSRDLGKVHNKFIKRRLAKINKELRGGGGGGRRSGKYIDPFSGLVIAEKKGFGLGANIMPAAVQQQREDQQQQQLQQDKDMGKLNCLAPGRVPLPSPDMKVVTLACGLHHTLLMTAGGQLVAFGSNSHGQLGVGDLVPRGAPVVVRLSENLDQMDEMVIRIAAGAYHSVALTMQGRVFTWGNNGKGQLGRTGPVADGKLTPAEVELWYARPGLIPGLGISHGKSVTWIGASADQTLLKLDESLINAQSLSRASICANQHHVLLLPTHRFISPHDAPAASTFNCLCIARQDGFCRSFASLDQVEWRERAMALDPLYNVLWSLGTEEGDGGALTVQCYNPTATDLADCGGMMVAADLLEGGGGRGCRQSILSPDLALPVRASCLVSRSQAALNLLSCLDTITGAAAGAASGSSSVVLFYQDEGSGDTAIGNAAMLGTAMGNGGAGGFKSLTRDDFSVANRFDSHGGGWGYSGHSIEAVRFSVDTDIVVGGYGLFGGRGEYVGKIKLFDLGPDGGEAEGDGDLIAESDEVTFECEARQKFPILFEEPVAVVGGRWYVAWARVSGPSSDCGSSGQSQVLTEDQVQFSFKSSKKSNNGTDVNAGQIPQILYRVVAQEGAAASSRKYSPPEPVYILSAKFGRPLTTDSFQALLSLLGWAWTTFKAAIAELVDTSSVSPPSRAALMDLQRLVFICRAAQRLLVTYVESIYPSPASQTEKDTVASSSAKSLLLTETQRLAECVYEVRTQLVAMLADPLPMLVSVRRSGQPANLRHQAIEMAELLLADAHKTFVACFHAFYPTGPLKWICLCSLLNSLDSGQAAGGSSSGVGRLLSAAIDSLCNPMIKLRCTFPIGLADGSSSTAGGQQSDSTKSESNTSPVDISNINSLSVTGSMLQPGDMSPATSATGCRYPILAEVMNYQSQAEAVRYSSWTFTDVLKKLLNIVTLPVRQSLQNQQRPVSSSQNELVAKACRLIASVIAELCNLKGGPEATLANLMASRVAAATPIRFVRINSSRTWNTGNGSPDALCFSVDRAGLLISGAGVFGGLGSFDYELELLQDQSGRDKDGAAAPASNHQSQRWISMEICHGTYTGDECVNDIYMIKFDKPVAIQPHVKYALRLRNHGGQTCNGDGGQTSVKGPDGTTFTFASCSLSFNGTNPTRGQIPQILYYTSPAAEGGNSGGSGGSVNDSSMSTVSIAQSLSHKSALSLTMTVVRSVAHLLMLAVKTGGVEGRSQEVLNSAPVVTTLLPHVLASVAGLATGDPAAAVQVISLIKDLLPKVAELNNQYLQLASVGFGDSAAPTPPPLPSPHYAWVESDHPYKPASIANYRVVFPPSVKWMAIEFDPACCTAQPEDTLQLYIRNPASQRPKNFTSPLITSQSVANRPGTNNQVKFQRYSPVLTKLSGQRGWPAQSVVLPGNEVLFSLETASDYVKGEGAGRQNGAAHYGFKCLVAGYEVQDGGLEQLGLRSLEHELAYLGGLCTASLMNKAIRLPRSPTSTAGYTPTGLSGEAAVSQHQPEEELAAAEAIAQELHDRFPSLLSKGFAIDRLPSIQQALTGTIATTSQSHERHFLKDFVNCVPGTAGGRLAAWLQPEPYVSVDNCGVQFRPQEELRCSWPTVITIVTRDQYGAVANVPNMKVEVKAIPVDEIGGGGVRHSKAVQPDLLTFGGHPPPSLDTKYEVTVKEKMFFHAITVSKAYEYYSFEELRWASPRLQRQAENMLVRPNGNGSYAANWTPGNVGWYRLSILLDGCELPAAPRLEVLEPPQGSSCSGGSLGTGTARAPPPPASGRLATAAPVSRLRQFIAKPSAGLRIRLHPTLQSEQIGVVPVDATVAIIDELANSDGVWVRLSPESLENYCTGLYPEAWCLQYHQHYERQLMKLITEPLGGAPAASSSVERPPAQARAGTLPVTFAKRSACAAASSDSSGGAFAINPEQQQQQRLFSLRQNQHPQTAPLVSSTAGSTAKRGPGIYTVVKCGASGHNIRCAPSLNAAAVGMLNLGDSVLVTEVQEDAGGSGECWVRLDRDSVEKFCFGVVDGDVWSLAVTATDTHYLESDAELQEQRWPIADGLVALGALGDGAAAASTAVSLLSPFTLGDDHSSSVWGPPSGLYTSISSTVTSFSPMDSSMGSPRSLIETPSSSAASTPVHHPRKSLPRPVGSGGGGRGPTSTPPMQRHSLFQSSGVGAAGGVATVGQGSSPPPSRGRSGTLERKSFFQKWFKSDSSIGDAAAAGSGRRNSSSSSPPAPTSRKSSAGPPVELRKPYHVVNKDIPPELQGVSVKELVKVIGASRANGNGVTPPSTPGTPRKSRSISPAGPVSHLAFSRSRSSSPISVGQWKSGVVAPLGASTGSLVASAGSLGASVGSLGATAGSLGGSAGSLDEADRVLPLLRQNSSPSDTSIMVSSLARDMSLISAGSNLARSSDLVSVAPSDGSVSPLSFRSDCVSGTEQQPAPSPRRPANHQRTDSQQYFPISTVSLSSSSQACPPGDSMIQIPEVAAVSTASNPTESGNSTAATSSWPKPAAAEAIKNAPAKTAPSVVTEPSVASETAAVVRDAMSPSVAESIRAVFAAFVWHSGIVQDTMACASFLKFNSGLTKQGGGDDGYEVASTEQSEDTSTGIADGSARRHPAVRQRTARQRHSVEVISTTYLNYKENDWVDRLSGGNANRNVIVNNVGLSNWEPSSGGQPPIIPEQEECEGSVRQSVPGLPPTLGQLVLLWEATVLSCLDAMLAQTGSCGVGSGWSVGGGKGTINISGAGGGSGSVAAFKNLKNNREANAAAIGSVGSGGSLFNNGFRLPPGTGRGNPVIERSKDESGSTGNKGSVAVGGAVCDNWLCDICGGFFEPPVTYHMRAAHPGCGGHAGGKGYNSGGQYCGGWAGNCGDGGIGGSSWYLICERCKERHRRKYQQHQGAGGNKSVGQGEQRFNPGSLSAMLASFSYAAASSPVGPQDCHVIMKANSMFLLELASSSSGGIGSADSRDSGVTVGRRQFLASGPDLETVSELVAEEEGDFAYNRFNCLAALGIQQDSSQVPKDTSALRFTEQTGANNPTRSSAPSDTWSYLPTAGESVPTDESSARATGEVSSSTTTEIDPPEEFQSNDEMLAAGSSTDDESRPTAVVVRRRNKFHRSLSIGSPRGKEWSPPPSGGLSAAAAAAGISSVLRKRNSSHEDQFYRRGGGGTDEFLAHTSPAWKRLFDVPVSSSRDTGIAAKLVASPVMNFLLQWNDLEAVRLAMQFSLRKAVCRVYALQAFNWLLRSVSQPVCLHDLLWCLISALQQQNRSRSQGSAAAVCGNCAGNAAAVEPAKKDDLVVSQAASGAAHVEGGDNLAVAKERDYGFEHPLSDLCLVGGAVRTLPATFHSLLQTISELMLVLPMGSSVQQAAVTCFAIQFWATDHSFLHRSQVFSTISKILSRGETADHDPDHSPKGGGGGLGAGVERWTDLTGQVEVAVSSRPGMVASLTDGSTETFWESGDEDRNKTKFVALKCPPGLLGRCLAVHVDNGRDMANKVSSITFRAGRGPAAADDGQHAAGQQQQLAIVKTVEVESRFSGWIHCFLTDSTETTVAGGGGNQHLLLRVEMRGPDNTVRLRQVKLIGRCAADDEQSVAAAVSPAAALVPNRAESARIQQANCEAETLRVFRLITSQVFGRLLEPEVESSCVEEDDEQDWDGGTDLKQHVVGILFSRSKLSHLQKQVCAHIVSAITKEASLLRNEWELSLCSEVGIIQQDVAPKLTSDTYCFEMLSMVLALSGSKVGRAYLSQQYSLLKDMLSFLHTGTARVQRAVVSVLRRVLPLVPPVRFANILSVSSLPPKDFTILNVASLKADEEKDLPHFDPNKAGVIDIFLGSVAKALTIQVKRKSNTGRSLSSVSLSSCIHPRDNVGARWWLRGSVSKKIAEKIISLLKDMTQGKFSEEWTQVSKSAIAEAVLNLTRLGPDQRQPEEGLRCPTLWLAVGALCVLDRDHVEGLSSGEWGGGNGSGQDRPSCDNHDDGETPAIILCDSCGNLCSDCDRFLHLHRRTRHHARQIFKEEEEAIKVNLHEGCGRTKLFWLTAAADSSTLKGMIEFREELARKGSSLLEAACRYCGGASCAALPVLEGVCIQEECQEHARLACTKTNPCGHPCGGIAGEKECLPCLQGCDTNSRLKQDGDDMCMICFTEPLSPIPSILMECGHVFHLSCARAVLAARWNGPRITFGFTQCPICKAEMQHPALVNLLEPIRILYDDVRKKALMRLEYEGLSKCDAITAEGARWFNNPTGFALERYAYYVCFKCNKAYFGGEARCDLDAGKDSYNPEELVCGGCSDVSQAQMCPKHGTDYLEYKCRYCCAVAVFFCFGTTHFCNACHDDFQRVTNIPKGELPQCPVGPKGLPMEGEECPLHVKHPPTGVEFALGCGVCRNAHTF